MEQQKIALVLKRPITLTAFLTAVLSVLCFYNRKLILLTLISILLVIAFIIIVRKHRFILPLIMCFCVMFNMLITYTRNDKINLMSKQSIHEKFVVTDCKYTDNDALYLKLKCISDSKDLNNLKSYCYYYGNEYITTGDIIKATVKLSKLNNNEKVFYYGDGIYFKSKIEEFGSVCGTHDFYDLIGRIKSYIINSDFEFLKNDTAALLVAITVGDKSYLSDRLYVNVKRAGVSHMMAVSGLHLSILLGSLFGLFEKVIKNKYLHITLSLLTVFMLIAVCGFSKSIIRAGLMFIIASIAPLFNRESDSLNSLGTAVMLVFLVSPFAAMSIAFRLSVLATFAIVYIAPFISVNVTELLKIKHKIPKGIIELVIMTVSATVATMPTLIKSFGEISAVNVLANLFLNLFVSAALIINAVSLLIPGVLQFLRMISFNIAGICSFIMVTVINGFGELPFATVNMGSTAYFISIIALCALIIAIDILKFRKRRRDNALWL